MYARGGLAPGILPRAVRQSRHVGCNSSNATLHGSCKVCIRCATAPLQCMRQSVLPRLGPRAEAEPAGDRLRAPKSNLRQMQMRIVLHHTMRRNVAT